MVLTNSQLQTISELQTTYSYTLLQSCRLLCSYRLLHSYRLPNGFNSKVVCKNSSVNIWEILFNITIPITHHKYRGGFAKTRGVSYNGLGMPWGGGCFTTGCEKPLGRTERGVFEYISTAQVEFFTNSPQYKNANFANFDFAVP